MAKTNDLQIAAWSAEAMLTKPLCFTRFRLSDDAQRTLLEWCRERTKRPDEPVRVVLQGLSEVTGLLVPEIAFLREEWDVAARVRHLCFYFLDDRHADVNLRNRMQIALHQWVGALYFGKTNALRAAVGQCAHIDTNWSIVHVDPALNWTSETSACPGVKDGLLWDGVTARAIAAVAGQELLFRSGERRLLVARTPQSSGLYAGVELVAWPPKSSPDGRRMWSEVITVGTATFPEQPGICLLARVSIRNWGPVTRWQSKYDPHRSLDVFIEPDPAFVGDLASGWRHSSFEYHAMVEPSSALAPGGQRPAPVPVWRHESKRDMFRLLQSMTGNQEVSQASLAKPMFQRSGLSVLPRLGSLHGDDQMSGGTGLPWPDREDITASLHRCFSAIGLEQMATMRRTTKRARQLPKCEDDTEAWRQAILITLRGLGIEDGTLDILLLRQLEDTPKAVIKELRAFLGEPATEKEGVLHWRDGLTIRVLDASAGPLAEQLPPWQKLTPEESSRYSNDQQRQAFQNAKRQAVLEDSRRAMENHITRARKLAGAGIACALLEMSADMKRDPWCDPFGMARQELARARCLPKVILTGKDESEHKYRFAVRDMFRLLGVPPVSASTFSRWDTLMAVTIVQRNGKIVSGRKRPHHAFPLAARVRKGTFECALLKAEGLRWLPYGIAVLQVLTGEYEHLERGHQSDSRFERFFAEIFAELRPSGNCLVMVVKELFSKVRTLQNGELRFDRLAFGNQVFLPNDLPQTRIVRIDNDHTKQPCFSHETDAKWVQGLFEWGAAKRTFYALKPKPPSISDASSYAAQSSRHDYQSGEPGSGGSRIGATRVLPQLGEFCAAFAQPEDEPYELVANAFALCKTHVQYDYHTNMPFPLHELIRIGKNIT